MKKDFVIGTRGSKLALWQAEFVRARLSEIYPSVEIRLEIIKTSGDKLQNVSLSVIGGQGVFTKELETALLDCRIDLAVHSLKDLPTVLPADLFISAVLPRENASDALVARKDLQIASLAELPLNSIVGTSSIRRAAQLKNLRPDLQIRDLRGNVGTRLDKLDNGNYDVIMLAVAGLKRLNLENRISAVFSANEMLPQVGQGALGIETRRGDVETNNLVAVLKDQETTACVFAERAFLRGLGGGCQFPIAANARIENDKLFLDGLVAEPSGAQILRGQIAGETANAETLGEKLANKLLDKGARELINQSL